MKNKTPSRFVKKVRTKYIKSNKNIVYHGILSEWSRKVIINASIVAWVRVPYRVITVIKENYQMCIIVIDRSTATF